MSPSAPGDPTLTAPLPPWPQGRGVTGRNPWKESGGRMNPKTSTAAVTIGLLAALAMAACGHRTKGDAGGAPTTVEEGNPAQPGGRVDPSAAAAAPAQPAASDVAGNAQTQGEVAAAGLDAAASAAAAGT